jgi:hypothetical protein
MKYFHHITLYFIWAFFLSVKGLEFTFIFEKLKFLTIFSEHAQ